MSDTVLFSKGSINAPIAPRSFDNDSKQYIHYIATMIHSEPIIERCFETVCAHTLMKGVQCTPRDLGGVVKKEFKQFVDRYYLPFCQDAIRMFLSLGFVVWRLKTIRVAGVVQKIPETLPLGTFTWTVKVQDKDSRKRKREGSDDLVYYDIMLNGIETDFHVFEFVKPNLTMQCVSGLSSVIPCFLRLQITRACKMRSDEWNATVRLNIEHNEKMLVNQMADDGSCLNTIPSAHSQFDSLYEDTLGDATESRATVIRKQAQLAGMPSNTHLFVLPKNHSARAMETVETPQGVPEAEIDFQRAVCYALGVPCSLVMQHVNVTTSGSSSTGANDNGLVNTQMLRTTCTRIAQYLEVLLQDVYSVAYLQERVGGADTEEKKSEHAPRSETKMKTTDLDFTINCGTVFSLGEIIELHFRKFVDDETVNEMLLNTFGVALNKSAERLPWNKTVQEPQTKDPKKV
eukprot:862360-Rhodomonas_salina.7